MIPLTFLYDEYIDRPKFTEQKKNPFEYIVPSPTSGVGTKKNVLKARKAKAENAINYSKKANIQLASIFDVFCRTLSTDH